MADSTRIAAVAELPPTHGTFDVVRRWFSRGALSILDQGLFSGANFLVSVYFARVLSPAEYGRFAIAFTCYLLLIAAHSAIVLDPLSVIGSKDSESSSHFASAFSTNLIACAGISLALVLTSTIGLDRALLSSLAFTAVSTFCYSLLRRVCYVEGASGSALSASIVYFVAAAGCLLWVRTIDEVSSATPFVVMGAAAMAAFFSLLPRRWTLLNPVRASRTTMLAAWRFGRWMLAFVALTWAAEFSYPLFLGWFTGASSAGNYRVAELSVMPAYQAMAALVLPLQPLAARRMKAVGWRGLVSLVSKAATIAGGLAAIYAVTLALFGEHLFSLIFPNTRYSITLVVPFAVWLVIRVVYEVGLSTAARAAELSRGLFIAGLSGVALLPIAALVVWHRGEQGAVLAKAVGTLIQAVVLFFVFRQAISIPPREILDASDR